jgi:hypothetical protein
MMYKNKKGVIININVCIMLRIFINIDYEQDEILYKVKNGWKLDPIYQEVLLKIEVPKDVMDHLI